MTERILKQFDVTGVKNSINIKTLNGNLKLSGKLVHGITISKQTLSAENQIHWIKLPKLYSKKEIPVNLSEVAIPLKVKK